MTEAWQWLTTYPNPRVRGYGADDGQRGWRTHAVWADNAAEFGDIRRNASACGIRPAHGWGMDMFIDRKCARCVKALTKINGENPESGREQALRRIGRGIGR